MTDTPPPVGDLTLEEAGIWPQGFDPEDAPPPLSPEDVAQLVLDGADAPIDYDTGATS